MNRRKFVGISIAGASAIAGLWAYGETREKPKEPTIKTPHTLPIPPLAEYKLKDGKKIFDLTIQKGEKSFFEDIKTETYGVNGDFLGPTIKVNNKDKVEINVTNKLDEETTLHWHGLHINGKNDGGPHQIISPNNTWKAKLKIDQRASTSWYHPHAMDKTGYQVYKGIAGFFLIDDEHSKKLPNQYGVDDIPLVIQDRRFSYNGSFSYIASMHDRMMGISGNYIFVNGAMTPIFEATKDKVRYRILNGSNSRIYMLGFEDEREFSLVATDGGFVEKPLSMTKLLLAPGERAEIVIDIKAKEKISLVDFLSKSYLLHINSKDTIQNTKALPKTISKISPIKTSSNERIREFNLSMGMGTARINGKKMDMDRIDFNVSLNTSEIWRIKNLDGMMNMPHPFHVHGCSFEVLSRNGEAPYIFEKGLKDTVLINKGDIVDIRVIFRKKADRNNPFMFHCHNLEHEDLGMMGQFTVS